MRIALAQINAHVGNISANRDKIIATLKAAVAKNVDVVVFPELAVCGYPPEDLLFRQGFHQQIEQAMADITAATTNITAVVGHPVFDDGALWNAASVLSNGKLNGTYFKAELPNYGVFDEQRYFQAGVEPLVVEIDGVRCGITICEDVWHPKPATWAKEAGAELLLNLNASPFHQSKPQQRAKVVVERCKEVGLPLCYANLVGGQDELVFDGYSMFVDGSGEIIACGKGFAEDLLLSDFTVQDGFKPVEEPQSLPENDDDLELLYNALVLGVRDYVNKIGFPGVVVGLSGGIDSALTLAVAVDALGADKVEAVLMPSKYTADISNSDAVEEAELLGVHYHSVPIEHARDAFADLLSDRFAGLNEDVTEENIQARIRGVLLMAISNKTGKMVLTTSNKSETAVGYATLYGDMCGGFGALKDVNKTLVYALSRYRNTLSYVIPERVITRAPSAELRPDQQDSDSLPPYDVLDPILTAWIEDELSVAEIVALGYDEAIVQRIVKMVMRNEYKRRQAAPGVKVTKLAFGRDRRYPICSGYKAGG